MPPQNEPQRPDRGAYYRQVSSADPLAQQSSPQSQPANFEFMFKEPPKPKRSFGLPSGMGRAGKILLVVVVLLLLVVAYSLLFGGGDSLKTQVLDLMARDQEIIRVSQLQDKNFNDPNTLNLSATAQTIMLSQQTEFGSYLKNIAKTKYGNKDLGTRVDKATDAQMQTAADNNSLDSAYTDYLKNSLNSYQSTLGNVYKGTKSKTLRSALQSAYDSVKVLLADPQFAQS